MKRDLFLLRSIAVCMLVSTFTITLQAQSGFVQDGEKQRPSTDSWNMVKYGDVGASLYTGTIQLNIPFYEYKDSDFTIPVSLAYSSNGLQPNKRGGVLGPDWTLMAGGNISIDIQGLPDLDDVDNGECNSYYNLHRNVSHTPAISKIWRLGVSATNYASDGTYKASLIHCFGGTPTAVGQKYDAMPDFFHFNFLGHTGSFHLGINKAVYVYNTGRNNKDYRISFKEGSTENVLGIIIETADGYKYEFLEEETSLPQDSETGKPLTVAYHLSTITAPNGRKVEYVYRNYDISVRVPAGVAMSGTQHVIAGNDYDVPFHGKNLEHQIVTIDQNIPVISQIKIDGGTVITFNYTQMPLSDSDEYGPINSSTTSIRHGEGVRMTGITVKTNNKTVKQCGLSYRKMTNGKRVNYLEEVNISGEGIYKMTYNTANNFPGNGTLSVDHWGYYNGKNDGNSTNIPFLKVCKNGESSETINQSTRDAVSAKAMTGILTKITYPSGGYSSFEYEGNDYSRVFMRDSLNHYDGSYITRSGLCGGVRIKSITHYDKAGVSLGGSSYSYKTGNTSNGTLLDYPRYHIKYSAQSWGVPKMTENIDYYSSSLTNYNGSHIEYSAVRETKSDGSIVEYTFSSSTSTHYADYLQRLGTYLEPYDPLTYGSWSIDNDAIASIVQPIVSMHGNRGKLLQKSIYKNSSENTPLLMEQYTYNTARELTKNYYPAYLIRKIANIPVIVDNYELKKRIIKEQRGNKNVGKWVTYYYNRYGQIRTIRSTKSNRQMLVVKTTYVTDLTSTEVNASEVYRFMKRRFDINRPLTVEHYVGDELVDSTLVGGERTVYGLKTTLSDTLLVKNRVEVYDPVAGSWKLKETYLKYDNRGRLLEMEDINGIKTSYVWGYGGLYPVLQGRNISISSLKSISGLQGIESSPLEGCLSEQQRAAIKTLCTNSNAEVEYYEYLPLVGISKLIDATGKVYTYEYNNGGKLKRVVDNEGKSVEGGYYSPDNKLPNL